MSPLATFVKAVADALWADAWLYAAENGDLTEGAAGAPPPTPRTAMYVAHEWLGQWGGSAAACAYLAAYARANGHTWCGDNDPDWAKIGYLWAMQAMGHGVGLTDNGETIPGHWRDTPDVETPWVGELSSRWLSRKARE